jgi:hypothetical protein
MGHGARLSGFSPELSLRENKRSAMRQSTNVTVTIESGQWNNRNSNDHSEEDSTNDGQRQSTKARRKSFQGSNKGVRELIHLGTKNIQAPKKLPLIKTCDHSTHVPTSTPLASRLLQEAGPASLFRCYSKQKTMRALMALLCSKFGVSPGKRRTHHMDFKFPSTPLTGS